MIVKIGRALVVCIWVKSQATNAWHSFIKFYSKVSLICTIIFILGAMNKIFHNIIITGKTVQLVGLSKKNCKIV